MESEPLSLSWGGQQGQEVKAWEVPECQIPAVRVSRPRPCPCPGLAPAPPACHRPVQEARGRCSPGHHPQGRGQHEAPSQGRPSEWLQTASGNVSPGLLPLPPTQVSSPLGRRGRKGGSRESLSGLSRLEIPEDPCPDGRRGQHPVHRHGSYRAGEWGWPPFCLVSQAPTLTENAISYFLYELVGLRRCHYL